MRTPYARFPEYHTSGDDLSFVHPAQLAEALAVCCPASTCSRATATYRNLNPKGEPQLGRRGIYRALADQTEDGLEMAMLWVLNGSDGTASLLDVARRSGLAFAKVRAAADVLVSHDLLAPVRELMHRSTQQHLVGGEASA